MSVRGLLSDVEFDGDEFCAEIDCFLDVIFLGELLNLPGASIARLFFSFQVKIIKLKYRREKWRWNSFCMVNPADAKQQNSSVNY